VMRPRLRAILAVLATLGIVVIGPRTASATDTPEDRDGDGILNTQDRCPDYYDPNRYDADSDGIPNGCDPTPIASPNAFSETHLRTDNHGGHVAGGCYTLTVHQADGSVDTFNNFCDGGGRGVLALFWAPSGGGASLPTRVTFELTSTPADQCATGAQGSGTITAGQLTVVDVVCSPPLGRPVAISSALATDWSGPYTLDFDGSGSFDPDGDITAYNWNFGDGTTATGSAVTHGYVGPGTFTVRLTVTDNSGRSATTFTSLTITGDPLKDFAPEVRLHPDEDHFPMNPSTFIANSHLEWAHDAFCADDYEVRRVSANRLGSGGYKHREASGDRCRHFGSSYGSDQYTRPFDAGKPGREPIANEEGFFLDFDESTEPTSFAQVPVWTEQANNVVTYWFFYGRSVPRANGVGLPAQHEGDWEHVNVELNGNGVPERVWYYAHLEPPNKLSYSTQIARSDFLHPVVYSARDAHASYSDAGTSPVCNALGCLDDERADGGGVWRTWLDVRPAVGQGWYGFGGAWGEKGEFSDTTGPLGPSYQNPRREGAG
jgi:PKD repeat protein